MHRLADASSAKKQIREGLPVNREQAPQQEGAEKTRPQRRTNHASVQLPDVVKSRD